MSADSRQEIGPLTYDADRPHTVYVLGHVIKARPNGWLEPGNAEYVDDMEVYVARRRKDGTIKRRRAKLDDATFCRIEMLALRALEDER